MSVLLSRNGQILAMCCLIVGSVLPSVRSRYNFRQNDQIWPTFAIITLNREYVFIYSMNWISLFVCYIPCAQQVTAVSHKFVLTLKIYKKKKTERKGFSIFNEHANPVFEIISPTHNGKIVFISWVIFLLLLLFEVVLNYCILPK